MRKLALSDKGFPVPYFAEWFDGKPDFRVVSAIKMMDAVRFNRCWVCDEPMGNSCEFVRLSIEIQRAPIHL